MFSVWQLQMPNFVSGGDHEHAGDIPEWSWQEQEDVTEDEVTTHRGWGISTRSREDCEVLVHCAEQPHRWDTGPTGKKRTTQGRRERVETAAHGVRTGEQCRGS